MIRTKSVLYALVFVSLSIGTSRADLLPAGETARLFETDADGTIMFDEVFFEGGPQTFSIVCGNCAETAIALVDSDGVTINALFTQVNDLPPTADGIFGTATWTSSAGGQVLVAPPGAHLFQNTGEPVEITNFIDVAPYGEHVYIQAYLGGPDVIPNPEPSTLILLASALLLAGWVGSKRSLARSRTCQ